MILDFSTLLQVLILAVGIYVVLGFLRTTRGTGLVRGLAVMLLLVFGGLFGLAKQLQLAELEFILQGVFGFIVVILAIVFQPELRRGIVSLGENPLLRRLVRQERKDVVAEVASAVVAMAKKKQGALIVLERDVPLDGYIRTGVRVDARVSRILLDSIFQNGGALHDGAVILRGDRVESAASILPLSENEELSKTVGTRHRAALGLAEETDAVAVVVSEETGLISVCARGQMERRIPRTEVESLLRERMGEEILAVARQPIVERIKGAFLDNLTHKALALALAVGLFWLAWRDVHREQTFELTVTATANGSRIPEAGELRLLLPDHLVVADLRGPNGERVERVHVRVDAPQARLEQLAAGVGGLFEVPRDWIGETRSFESSAIVWGADGPMPGIEVEWSLPEALTLRVIRYVEGAVRVDPSELDFAPTGVADGLEIAPGSLHFDPPVLSIVGPPEEVERYVSDPSSLPLMPPDLDGAEGSSFSRRVTLRQDAGAGVELVGDVFVHGDLIAQARDLGSLFADVKLVSFEPNSPDPLSRFEPPLEQVELRIWTRDLLPRNAGDEVLERIRLGVRDFVKRHVRVYVDVDRLDGPRGMIEVADLDEAWRGDESPAFDAARDNPRAELWLEVSDDDKFLVLTARESAPPGDDPHDE